MKFKTLLATVTAVSALAFTGCTVDKTQEGNLPDVDVETKGETQVPEYDVKPADVDVGTTRTTVNVPTVDVNMQPHDNQTPVPAPNE